VAEVRETRESECRVLDLRDHPIAGPNVVLRSVVADLVKVGPRIWSERWPHARLSRVRPTLLFRRISSNTLSPSTSCPRLAWA
jgi:hypothetical protein